MPDVIDASYADAVTTLNKWKLRPTTPGKSGPSDIVVEQEPMAGTYVSPLAEVGLTLRLMTPDVLNRRQTDAVAVLAKYDLRWTADTKVFENDKVVAQEPLAGELVERGDLIKLTLHLIVPDVQGRSLADARRTLERWDLEPDVPNGLAHEVDVVRGQDPAAGTYVPHTSRARLSPVMARVPDVRGSSVDSAERRLQNVENFAVRRYGDLIDEDEVTMQRPAPGSELERGGTITLDGRVGVPNVQGQRIFAGRNEIQSAPGNLDVVFNSEPTENDLVWGQVPDAGTLVFPRSRVTLIPGVRVPRLYGMSPNQAEMALANVGLGAWTVASSTRETGDRHLVGQSQVTGQTPEPGLHRRDRVTGVQLDYTTWVLGERVVPDVVDRSPQQAIALVRQADLEPVILYQDQRYSVDDFRSFLAGRAIAGLIAGQANQPMMAAGSDPEGGTRVAIGSRVLIAVVVGTPFSDGESQNR